MRSGLSFFAAVIAATSIPAFAQSVLNSSPSRVVGQPALVYRSSNPNLTEGREFLSPGSLAIDRSTSPAALYVADVGNNRVLAWRNSAGFSSGSPADFVIGQVDSSSTVAQGPGTSRTTGVTAPTGVAVDAQGNLYVVDTGNNRILRFPRPAAATQDIAVPDLVIGQPGFTSNVANNGGISEKTISLASGSLAFAALAFDTQGNLWFTDALNNRVLRYPAASLAANVNQPAADMVLGQPDFVTNTIPSTLTSAQQVLSKAILRTPRGITTDSDGRVYVSDSLGRVLVYNSPSGNGSEANRILGLQVLQQGQTAATTATLLSGPQGLVMAGNRLGVVDASLNRILFYDPAAQWPAETAEVPSPAATTVLGQVSFTAAAANRGQAEPSEATLASPSAAAYSGTELFVADSGNNRVLVFPQLTTGGAASRLLGQTNFIFNAPNLVEGRELFLFNGYSSQANLSGSFSDGGGVALDNASNPPHLYIADTFNNRILCWRDARRVRPGDKADLVIGQNDFSRVLVNAPANRIDALTASGLYHPSGLAVDASGNLYVADSGNGRVLRFPKPFEQNVAAGDRLASDLVLGQLTFTQKVTDASSRNMSYPFGIAFTFEGHLLVSDALHSRVLYFRKPATGDFTNGQAADRVIGQSDFLTVGAGSTQRRMNSPRHIATDTDDRLYVADAGNNRVLVYDRITVVNNDPAPAILLTGVTSPQGVTISPSGEVWVANTRGNRAVRYRPYNQLILDQTSTAELASTAPLALTQDKSGNLYIAEGSNRVATFYNALTFQVAGNYSNRALSPGAIATVYPAGTGLQFSSTNAGFSTLPLPTSLSDVQVLINANPVPLYFVSPQQINFLVPMSAPDSGTAEVQVVQQSTGQILAVTSPNFDKVSPALFVQGAALEGQVAALNQDNSINGSSNGAVRGTIVQMFGTGQGFVPNAPPDGTAPTGPLPTQDTPSVYLGGKDFVKASDVTYSGLAPGFVGLWQINARIPQDAAPGANDAFVVLRSVPSNRTSNSQTIRTTIYVRP